MQDASQLQLLAADLLATLTLASTAHICFAHLQSNMHATLRLALLNCVTLHDCPGWVYVRLLTAVPTHALLCWVAFHGNFHESFDMCIATYECDACVCTLTKIERQTLLGDQNQTPLTKPVKCKMSALTHIEHVLCATAKAIHSLFCIRQLAM